MQYSCEAFFNTNSRFAMTDGYTGEMVKRSVLGVQMVRATSAKHAADKLFAMLNRDDRPNGKLERSLSVGDVVAVWENAAGSTSTAEWYAVESFGFRVIDQPIHG